MRKKIRTFLALSLAVMSIQTIPVLGAVQRLSEIPKFVEREDFIRIPEEGELAEALDTADFNISLYCMSEGKFMKAGDKLLPGFYQLKATINSGNVELQNCRMAIKINSTDGLKVTSTATGTVGEAIKKRECSPFMIHQNLQFDLMDLDRVAIFDTLKLQGTQAPYYGQRNLSAVFNDKMMAIASDTGTSGIIKAGGAVSVTITFTVSSN